MTEIIFLYVIVFLVLFCSISFLVVGVCVGSLFRFSFMSRYIHAFLSPTPFPYSAPVRLLLWFVRTLKFLLFFDSGSLLVFFFFGFFI